ncbi:MAG TPA: sulfite exporter TauE/SafE family protein [Sphingobacteriaceae bacterium]|nr:sulfite exporter TauE/SafE family protein [Sphingobacteriaceae bacterium]
MSINYLAFFMGLLGSLHCVAMCGPLLLALPAGKGHGRIIFNRIIYQIGRILTYTGLGLVIGFISIGAEYKGWQQGLSIFTGGVLVSMGLFTFFGHHSSGIVKAQQKLFAPLFKRMGYWLYKPGGNFIVGMLNGFLPCGMVYMALATALNTGNTVGGGRFMLLFGLGTLPLMLITGIAGNYVKRIIPFKLSTWLPTLFLIMGLWFILRGSNLDIPYLSPLIYPEGMVTCN